MNRLSSQKQADILEDMMERKSLRGCARTMPGNSKVNRKGVSINTVLSLLADAGDAAVAFLDEKMRDLPTRRVEADEVYAIVRMKPRTLHLRGIRITGLGAVWIWVALDPVNKLILEWHLGDRTYEHALAFMRKLSRRLPHKVQLTTDSLAAYTDAVADAFSEIDYATVKKRDEIEEQKRLFAELHGLPYRPPKGVPKPPSKPVHHLGDPDDRFATTNHIESFFAKFREDLSRMTRRSRLVSKKVENLNRMIALYVFHHNFVKLHGSLRMTIDGVRRKVTPALYAGIDDSQWTWEDFIDIVDDFRVKRRKALAMTRPVAVDVITPTPLLALPEARTGSFCVFNHLLAKTAKVHLAYCAHLRTAPGRAGTKGTGRKLYCDTLEAARLLAKEVAGTRVNECNVCLGKYNSKGYLGPRGPAKRP